MRIETQKKWKTLIQQQTDGDLTITQFCKVKSISPTCFFKYRKILQVPVTSRNSKVFVKIQPPKVNNSCDAIKIQYHQSTLIIPPNLEPVWIAVLLKALA